MRDEYSSIIMHESHTFIDFIVHAWRVRARVHAFVSHVHSLTHRSNG